MSEVALYRKYRPQTFKEVLGQEHIVSVLEGALKRGTIAHAYLFAGSRGTGKTSVARILARELKTHEHDLYEIDAASNRGIDDIRELREAVYVLPFSSPYKVYIIDEAHMLTKEAFNALLKTLEEPPPHALFVLATTELERLPETIVSRCQTFVFRKPTLETLKEMIVRVAKHEGYVLERASAGLIALLAEGSFRDAHGILQKIITSSKEKNIYVEDVERVAGAPPHELLNEVLTAIDESDLATSLTLLRRANEQNVEMKLFLKLLLTRLRTLLLLKYAPDLAEELRAEHGEHDFEVLQRFAKKKDTPLNSRALKIFLEAESDVSRAYVPVLALELALMTLLGNNGA